MRKGIAGKSSRLGGEFFDVKFMALDLGADGALAHAFCKHGLHLQQPTHSVLQLTQHLRRFAAEIETVAVGSQRSGGASFDDGVGEVEDGVRWARRDNSGDVFFGDQSVVAIGEIEPELFQLAGQKQRTILRRQLFEHGERLRREGFADFFRFSA